MGFGPACMAVQNEKKKHHRTKKASTRHEQAETGAAQITQREARQSLGVPNEIVALSLVQSKNGSPLGKYIKNPNAPWCTTSQVIDEVAHYAPTRGLAYSLGPLDPSH
jgi:hypothetical protein